jgi:hypothetical protein
MRRPKKWGVCTQHNHEKRPADAFWTSNRLSFWRNFVLQGAANNKNLASSD